MFRLLAAVVAPLGLLAVLEVGLRLAGFGFRTAFFVPHPAVERGALVENQRFPRRFFPPTLARFPEPVLIQPRKTPGTVRIFVFGESAAMGDPAPAFSFPRILEVLLRDRYPGTRFEVVNLAFTAINSHVILPMARDCRALEADAWLVYMGNNEVIGPFGTGTVFNRQSPPLAVIRAGLAFRSTRVGQLCGVLLRAVGGARAPTNGWAGMDMFLEQQVRAEDPRLDRLAGHFRRNLGDLIDMGRGAGAQVMVSTMASRVRDWPPFGSMHRPGLNETEQARWRDLFDAGIAAEAAGDSRAALTHYEAAAAIDAEYAELHYRWGRCCLALGFEADAVSHLTKARDLDTLRFRTDTRLNAAIRSTVSERQRPQVRLLDAEERFAAASPARLPGAEWFHEHVHFTFAGNYLLARMFAEEVAAALSARLGTPRTPGDEWLSEAECAEQLGYTQNQAYEVGILLRRRFGEAIYRSQVGYAERYEALQQRLADLRQQTKPTARRQALQICRAATERAPGDWVLHDLTARLLVALGDGEGAVASWRRVTELIPHSPVAYTEWGKLVLARGGIDEARLLFEKAIAVNPDSAPAHAALGSALAREGKTEAARRQFQRALRLDPACEDAVTGMAALTGGAVPPR